MPKKTSKPCTKSTATQEHIPKGCYVIQGIYSERYLTYDRKTGMLYLHQFRNKNNLEFQSEEAGWLFLRTIFTTPSTTFKVTHHEEIRRTEEVRIYEETCCKEARETDVQSRGEDNPGSTTGQHDEGHRNDTGKDVQHTEVPEGSVHPHPSTRQKRKRKAKRGNDGVSETVDSIKSSAGLGTMQQNRTVQQKNRKGRRKRKI